MTRNTLANKSRSHNIFPLQNILDSAGALYCPKQARSNRFQQTVLVINTPVIQLDNHVLCARLRGLAPIVSNDSLSCSINRLHNDNGFRKNIRALFINLKGVLFIIHIGAFGNLKKLVKKKNVDHRVIVFFSLLYPI